jgi:hypothetical protein
MISIPEKERHRGDIKKGCRCGERLRARAGGGESLQHTRWTGGRGYLRTGKCIEGERFVGWRGLGVGYVRMIVFSSLFIVADKARAKGNT